MKVLALVTEAFGGYGGIAQSTQDVLSVMAEQPEVSVHILPRIVRSSVDTLPAGILQERPIRVRGAYAVRATLMAIAEQPHVLYCGHVFMAQLAAGLARLTGSRLVTHVHGLEIWKPLSWARRHGLLASDLVLTVSADTRDRLVAIGVPKERIEIIYNTYGDEFVPGDRVVARRAYGLGDETVLLTVSRLDATNHKGHDQVIPLVADLRRNGRNVVYLVAGVGDDQERLKGVASQLGIAEYVRFLGKVKAEELPALYRAADLYVMPSTQEGFGIAFVESMGSGTPAVGLALGGATDALRHGELGWAVDREGFVGAVCSALDRGQTDSERTALAAATRAHFGKSAFRQRVQSAMESIFD